MASLASTTIFSLFLLLSLAIQPNVARESKFFTKLVHYMSNSPIVSSSSPAPAPILVPGLAPMSEPLLAPGLSPAPEPAEKEYGYGLYGQGAGEYSSEEYRTSTLDQGFKNEIPEDEEELGSPPFENTKLLGSNNNGYSNNENVYSNVNNGGYNNNGYSYSNNYNYNDNGNRFSSSMDENKNGYTTNSYNQNNNDNYNTMRFGNENNGNEFMSSKERNDAYNNNNNGYVMEQQGLSDTRFLDNDKYSYNNGNNQETSYEEEVNDNGSQGYYNRNNEKSKYEFDTMEEYERQQGYPENDPSGYVP